MLNLQHALFCNDVSAHTHIYTHIILYKASIWILNVLFLITPLRIILLFTAPPKIIVHCAHYIESPYELCCILAHELLCVSRTFLKAPPQRMMLYFLLCLYTPLYSMHFVQTRHKNDCASHKNRPALLLCTLVPILFFAIYKQIKKVFLRQRPYRVECTGSLPNSEVKRRRARLVLGWGTAREDLRVLLAFWNCKNSDVQRNGNRFRLQRHRHAQDFMNSTSASAWKLLAVGIEPRAHLKKACVTASARVWYLEPKWLRWKDSALMPLDPKSGITFAFVIQRWSLEQQFAFSYY